MILEEKTKTDFGYYSYDLKPSSTKKIYFLCETCKKTSIMNFASFKNKKQKDKCKACITRLTCTYKINQDYFNGINFNPAFYSIGDEAVSFKFIDANYLRSTNYAISRAAYTQFYGIIYALGGISGDGSSFKYRRGSYESVKGSIEANRYSIELDGGQRILAIRWWQLNIEIAMQRKWK